MFPFSGTIRMTGTVSTRERRSRTCFCSTVFTKIICHLDYSKVSCVRLTGFGNLRLYQKRTQHSLPASLRFGSGKAIGSRIRKSSLCPRGRTHQASFDLSFRPIVRFTRFNRIEIWSLHVNANRYVYFSYVCFVNMYFVVNCKITKYSPYINMLHNIFTSCGGKISILPSH